MTTITVSNRVVREVAEKKIKQIDVCPMTGFHGHVICVLTSKATSLINSADSRESGTMQISLDDAKFLGLV